MDKNKNNPVIRNKDSNIGEKTDVLSNIDESHMTISMDEKKENNNEFVPKDYNKEMIDVTSNTGKCAFPNWKNFLETDTSLFLIIFIPNLSFFDFCF